MSLFKRDYLNEDRSPSQRKTVTSQFSPVGGSSLMVIFSVLCLTVFALLALTTVQADLRQAKESRQALDQYAAADREAEEILADLRQGKSVDGVVQEGNYFAYDCPVSDTQTLAVVVCIRSENDYEILRWKEERTDQWNPDESMKLWDPENPENNE